VTPRPLAELIDPGWAQALAPVEDVVARMGEFLRAEVAAGRGYLPAGENVLRAFQRPFDEVRVLIVGQDPYPTPGHPVGLSFSVAPDVCSCEDWSLEGLSFIADAIADPPRASAARARSDASIFVILDDMRFLLIEADLRRRFSNGVSMRRCT